MSKTPDPVEVVRDKVVPAAEELVASVAERVAPIAKEAVDQVGPVAQAAADRTVALVHAAAEKVGPLTHQAVEAVTPIAQQTREAVAPYAHSAADAVAPYAHTAADKVAPLAHGAAERVGPLAHQAADAVAPYAALAAERGRKAGHDLAGRLEPAYEAAVEALSGATDKVRDKVSDVVPALATAAPVAVVAPPRKKGRWVAVLAVVAAAAGATYVVVRRLTGDKASQWQAARPTTPYVPPTSAEAAAGARPDPDSGEGHTGPRSAHQVYAAADGAPEPDQPAEGGVAEVEADLAASGVVGSEAEESARDAGDPGPSTDSDRAAVEDRVEQIDEVSDVDEGLVNPGPADEGDVSSTGDESGASAGSSGDSAPDDEPRSPYSEEQVAEELETAEERVYEEPEDAVTIEQDTASGVGPDAHPGRYDDVPGVYLGVEPPEGYTIKGNERSMKYHTPDSNSYARTIAEVWFDSEEAAQQAGFTRAQH